jgi:hypothetical protein
MYVLTLCDHDGYYIPLAVSKDEENLKKYLEKFIEDDKKSVKDYNEKSEENYPGYWNYNCYNIESVEEV